MNLIILRGVSGSGKSTFAELFLGYTICSADDYFLDDKGNYNFDRLKIGKAHSYCFQKFTKAVKEFRNIVISNTCTTETQFEWYINTAKEHGYKIFSVVVENRHGGTDVHSVPEETKIRQEEDIKRTLKLR